jgi:hypothetical protein
MKQPPHTSKNPNKLFTYNKLIRYEDKKFIVLRSA